MKDNENSQLKKKEKIMKIQEHFMKIRSAMEQNAKK